MIVVNVRFPTNGAERTALEKKMLATAPKYEKLDGLIRKYYVMSEDGQSAGGVYLWESKAKAQAWFTADWTKYMTDAWGKEPVVEYLDCPIVVDSARVNSRVAA